MDKWDNREIWRVLIETQLPVASKTDLYRPAQTIETRNLSGMCAV